MRGYGLPRHKAIECPDKADIAHYGLSGHAETGKTSSRKRKGSRRIWKKRARRAFRADSQDLLKGQ